MSNNRRDGGYIGYARTATSNVDLESDGVWDIKAQNYWQGKNSWPSWDPANDVKEYLIVNSDGSVPIPSIYWGGTILAAGVAAGRQGGGAGDLVGQTVPIPPETSSFTYESRGNPSPLGAQNAYVTLNNPVNPTIYVTYLNAGGNGGVGVAGAGGPSIPPAPVIPLLPTYGTPSWSTVGSGGDGGAPDTGAPGNPGITGGSGGNGLSLSRPQSPSGIPGGTGGSMVLPPSVTAPQIISPLGYGPAPTTWSISSGPLAGGAGGAGGSATISVATPGQPGTSLPYAIAGVGLPSRFSPQAPNRVGGGGGGGAGCGVSFTDPANPIINGQRFGGGGSIAPGGLPGAPGSVGILYVRISRN